MSERKPYFSVVIPLYNKAPHVARSINSVLNQSFNDFEVIIVNDASTDNSIDEVKKFNDKRIRIFHREQPGPGGYAARNLGIKEAKSDWVAFIDADDEWFPDHLERVRELIIKYPEVNIIGCGWRKSMNGSFWEDAYYRRYNGRGSHMIDARQYLSFCLAGMRPIHTSLACINKNSPLALNLFPSELKAKRGGDLHAWLKMICFHKEMAWSDHLGANYFLDSQNMVTKTAPSSFGLMTREVYKELSVKLSIDERVLLKKYLNLRLKSSWMYNIKRNAENFNLIQRLYWSGDMLNAFKYSFFSIMPSPMLNVAISVNSLLKRNA
ncbi:MAG TPA: glycosyltransferase family 2 protein [Campylobacterales bacterium]|nr:glycosyltransferase family 2 protein [Campylobacterales bacterium]